jgi:hypothetical protein
MIHRFYMFPPGYKLELSDYRKLYLPDIKQGKRYMMQRTVGANSAAQKTPAVTCLSHRYQTVSA